MSSDKNESELFMLETATAMNQQILIDVLFEFCIHLASHLEIKEIEGKSPVNWINNRKIEKIEEFLIKFEDKNPALAAKFQARLDKLKKS